MIDNGAFSFWSKARLVDWNEYYNWIEEIYSKIEYFIIPDVIDGTEEENDGLIKQYFEWSNKTNIKKQAIPVWHIAESFERLERLMNKFDYIAFGSSGEYSSLGTNKWHKRMNEAMKIVCDKDGIPLVKIHMLRCLNPKIFTKYPFHSGDSTNLARNHSRDGYRQILNRIHKYDSPTKYIFRNNYITHSLFGEDNAI